MIVSSLIVVGFVVLLLMFGLLLVLFLRGQKVNTSPVEVTSFEQEIESLKKEKAGLEIQLAVDAQKLLKINELEKDLAEAMASLDEVREKKAAAERGEAVAKESVLQMESALEARADEISALKTDNDALIAQIAALNEARSAQEVSIAKLTETLTQERRQASEKLLLLNEAKEQLTAQFKVVANDVFKQHGETFTKQNKDQLEIILDPMRAKLAEFQKSLLDVHVDSAKERATLGEQIRALSEASAVMTVETTNLTRALKGKVQTQGAWGELVLETILQKSGLREGQEYITQESLSTEDGKRLRPDVIVKLPGGQQVILIQR